jgi:hypothetical protein
VHVAKRFAGHRLLGARLEVSRLRGQEPMATAHGRVKTAAQSVGRGGVESQHETVTSADLVQQARQRALQRSRQLEESGGVARQARQRTIDPSSRSQPVWQTRSGGRGQADRSRLRLWGVSHGVFDEATAPLVPVPASLKRLAGRHLPRQRLDHAEEDEAQPQTASTGAQHRIGSSAGSHRIGSSASSSGSRRWGRDGTRAADWGVWGGGKLSETRDSRPLTVHRRRDRLQDHNSGAGRAGMDRGLRAEERRLHSSTGTLEPLMSLPDIPDTHRSTLSRFSTLDNEADRQAWLASDRGTALRRHTRGSSRGTTHGSFRRNTSADSAS